MNPDPKYNSDSVMEIFSHSGLEFMIRYPETS